MLVGEVLLALLGRVAEKDKSTILDALAALSDSGKQTIIILALADSGRHGKPDDVTVQLLRDIMMRWHGPSS